MVMIEYTVYRHDTADAYRVYFSAQQALTLMPHYSILCEQTVKKAKCKPRALAMILLCEYEVATGAPVVSGSYSINLSRRDIHACENRPQWFR